MRVHEFAKLLGKQSKEIISVSKKRGLDVKSHMSVLEVKDFEGICTACGIATPPAVKKLIKAEMPEPPKPVKKADVPAKKPVEKKPVVKKYGLRKVSSPVVDKDAAAKKKPKRDIAVSEDVKKRIAEKLSSTPEPKVKFKRPVQSQQKKTFPQKRAATPTSAKTPAPAQPTAAAGSPSSGKPGASKDQPVTYHEKEEGRMAPPPSRKTVEERPGKDSIEIRLPITVGALATNMDLKTSALIKMLMMDGIFANVNQPLNEEIVRKIADKYEVSLSILPTEEEEILLQHEADEPTAEEMEPRAPVVTLMGHVDHGKTSLLDAVRDSRLVDREAGKITQHIGAYSVDLEGKGKVTFLDTPGHEAFTAMRARGANVTDVVVLVVAADDGVMPQTVEAINHSKAAGVPIVVAINKSDLPGANPDRVKAELQQHGLMAEEWGGKTILVSVSALQRTGINELLEMLLLEAEILELKAAPKRQAQGVVLEARVTKSHGVVTHVLVTNGTLKVGDYLICGKYFGRVRAMHNDKSKNIREAGPSSPVEIFGVQGVPNAADKFYVVADEKTARRISDQKIMQDRERELSAKLSSHITLESLYDKMADGIKTDLKLIVKADVQGSVEVLKHSLEKVSNEKVQLKIIHTGVGGINESDTMLAAASDAIIIGFHVKANMRAQALAEQEGIDIRYYKIIYDAIQDVKTAMEGRLAPTLKEVVMGTTEIRETFKASKVGTIAGCYVLKGKIGRNHKIRILRDDVVVYEGSITSLKRFKDDAREVRDGFECGVTINNFNDMKVGDLIESYIEEEVATKLEV